MSLSSYVHMSDEGIDCHIVKVCEHLTLPLLQALITSHLSLQAAARQSFVFSPVYFLYLWIFFLDCFLLFHLVPPHPFPLLTPQF